MQIASVMYVSKSNECEVDDRFKTEDRAVDEGTVGCLGELRLFNQSWVTPGLA